MWHMARGKFKNLIIEKGKWVLLTGGTISLTVLALSVSHSAAKPYSDCQLVSTFSGISKRGEAFQDSSIQFLPPKLNSKIPICGDDSWFVTTQKSCDVLGIADGVGGWSKMGVDPSIFSSNLMLQCKRVVDQDTKLFANLKKVNESTPVEILSSGYSALLESKDPTLAGSSTACILVFNRETKMIFAANLGDSGFAIVRNNKVVHRSQELCHFFNCPFQLSLVPPEMGSRRMVADTPQNAATSSFELAEGDLIILATDGLWDNLSEEQILLKLNELQVNFTYADLKSVAQSIVNLAYEYSQKSEHWSPFSLTAKKYGYAHRGGKIDDISLVLAGVCMSNKLGNVNIDAKFSLL